MKVLIAIDSFSKLHVVDAVLSRHWPEGTAFCVISVVDLRYWEGLPMLIEDAKREAAHVAKAAVDKLSKSGHAVFSEIPVGSPKEAIPDYARRWGADLIMVGSHNRSLERLLLGSVAHAVVRTAPCSVEIVRYGVLPAVNPTKVLVATDGSECSAKAVAFVANCTWMQDVQVRVLSVVQLLALDLPSASMSFLPPVPEVTEAVCRESRARAGKAVDSACQTLKKTGRKLCACNPTPEGDPRGIILDEAKLWGADMIVLGSHGRHGVERLLMGSVAEGVASHATCSITVVR
jgi:nucleotide-binding universal stress UspA family protein